MVYLKKMEKKEAFLLGNIKSILATFGKKTIHLSELEQLCRPFARTYDEFAQVISQLEEDQILTPIKARGRSSRNPYLAYQYRIQKHLLTENYHKEILRARNQFHHLINLDSYFQADPTVWKDELTYLKKIDHYLKTNELPKEQVPAPERSFELVGDEKWIVERGGKELLERINLYEHLQIVPVSEPLMFAINPVKLQDRHHYHLIVENKTTYQALLPVITESAFATLIYGRGKAVIKSIEQFPIQYPIKADHCFYYFGDLDREGILIWDLLNKKQQSNLALPFYEACLQTKAVEGKQNHRHHEEAEQHFLAQFTPERSQQIKMLLSKGYYYPQETLKTKLLQQIWRETDWTSLNCNN